jgi:hypothetical protein
MQRLEVSGAVRHMYMSLGVKGLRGTISVYYVLWDPILLFHVQKSDFIF